MKLFETFEVIEKLKSHVSIACHFQDGLDDIKENFEYVPLTFHLNQEACYSSFVSNLNFSTTNSTKIMEVYTKNNSFYTTILR